MLVSQNFFCCSQNLPKHILVLKKSILKPLFTVYKLFWNVNFGVDPLPPFGKSLHFGFFLGPFPYSFPKWAWKRVEDSKTSHSLCSSYSRNFPNILNRHINTVHCALYTVQCIVYTVCSQCPLYCVRCTLHIVSGIVKTAHSTAV